MAEPAAPQGAEAERTRTEDGALPIDWSAIEAEPEFQQLVRRRRAFVLPATAFFLLWYMAFIVVVALFPDTMGEEITNGWTVGYVYALTQILMVFVLGIWYLRKSANEFDPMAERVIERYASEHPEEAREAQEAFERGEGRFVGEKAKSSQEVRR
jgi:uncharacterized membrane protein (DUF485 family)